MVITIIHYIKVLYKLQEIPAVFCEKIFDLYYSVFLHAFTHIVQIWQKLPRLFFVRTKRTPDRFTVDRVF